jgi:hypothetical protein
MPDAAEQSRGMQNLCTECKFSPCQCHNPRRDHEESDSERCNHGVHGEADPACEDHPVVDTGADEDIGGAQDKGGSGQEEREQQDVSGDDTNTGHNTGPMHARAAPAATPRSLSKLIDFYRSPQGAFKYNDLLEVLETPSLVRMKLAHHIGKFNSFLQHVPASSKTCLVVKRMAFRSIGAWTFYTPRPDDDNTKEQTEWDLARKFFVMTFQLGLPHTIVPFDNVSVEYFDVSSMTTWAMLHGFGSVGLWELWDRAIRPGDIVTFYTNISGKEWPPTCE